MCKCMPNYRPVSRLIEFTAVINSEYLARLESARKKNEQPRVDAQGQQLYWERKQTPPRAAHSLNRLPSTQRSFIDDIVADVNFDFTYAEFLLAKEFNLPHKTNRFAEFLPSDTHLDTYENNTGKIILRGKTTRLVFERVFGTQIQHTLFFISEQEARGLPPNYILDKKPFNFYWVVIKPAEMPISFKDKIESFTITDIKEPEITFCINLKQSADAARVVCELNILSSDLSVVPTLEKFPDVLLAQTSRQTYEHLFLTTLQYDPQRLSAEHKQAIYVPFWKQTKTPTIPLRLRNSVDTILPQDPATIMTSLKDALPDMYK